MISNVEKLKIYKSKNCFKEEKAPPSPHFIYKSQRAVEKL
nr:MAG TPA: hypothetical protein [Caudoviricetes sp.]